MKREPITVWVVYVKRSKRTDVYARMSKSTAVVIAMQEKCDTACEVRGPVKLVIP